MEDQNITQENSRVHKHGNVYKKRRHSTIRKENKLTRVMRPSFLISGALSILYSIISENILLAFLGSFFVLLSMVLAKTENPIFERLKKDLGKFFVELVEEIKNQNKHLK